jgi:hypothetical protein
MLIKDHTTYTSFFRLMAENHLDILHTPQECHFVRMNLSAHPVLAREDIKEFLRSLKNKLKFPALLLNTYQAKADAQDSRDAKRKVIQGEFFILDRLQKDNWDEQDEVFEATEAIGTDILALLAEYYEDTPQEGYFEWNDTMMEKISNLEVDNLAGTKFYFAISIPNEVAFQLNQSRFKDELFNPDPENPDPSPVPDPEPDPEP